MCDGLRSGWHDVLLSMVIGVHDIGNYMILAEIFICSQWLLRLFRSSVLPLGPEIRDQDMWWWWLDLAVHIFGYEGWLHVHMYLHALAADTHIVVKARACNRSHGQLWAHHQLYGPWLFMCTLVAIVSCSQVCEKEIVRGEPSGVGQWQELWPDLDPQEPLGTMAVRVTQTAVKAHYWCVHSSGGPWWELSQWHAGAQLWELATNMHV